MRKLLYVFAVATLLCGCGCGCDEEIPPYGIRYNNDGLYDVFDMSSLASLRVTVTVGEWNRLLTAFDTDRSTETYVECDAEYTRGGITLKAPTSAIRLRGNTSRTRPEGGHGEPHRRIGADWHHTHFQLKTSEYIEDQSFNGVEKIALKWFHEDPTYVREIYGYDLFRRYGVWTAVNSCYTRLKLHIAGEAGDVDYGIYGMYETIDKNYLRARARLFGDSQGVLWKCYWDAGLNDASPSNFALEREDGSSSRPKYELKTHTDDFDNARAQLTEFIRNVKNKSGDAFDVWISGATDVDLLLRTYAVSTIIGHWDDYWGNGNNYYIYFNSKGKFYMIPYDLDNTLGTCQNGFPDGGTGDMLVWGGSSRPLIYKILQIERYRKKYIEYLHELADPANDLFSYTRSIARIFRWHSMIRDYVVNDTGEDCTIDDRPASWGSRGDYRVYSGDTETNFFLVRAAHLPDCNM